MSDKPQRSPIVVSYGGGVNSTAMILGLLERGETPNLILFSDTGGEKPETYAFIERFNEFLVSRWTTPITTVSKGGTLETMCLNMKTLPSVVFGRKSCSDHFKLRPQKYHIARWMNGCDLDCPVGGRNVAYPVVRLIGFDVGERQRVRESEDKKYINRFPLVEWEWDRTLCIATIERHGLCVPPKSACFFCPNTRESEVLALKDKHPDLFQRAVEMERNAKPNLTTIRGLARNLSWEQIGHYDEAQLSMLPKRDLSAPCECFDGDET